MARWWVLLMGAGMMPGCGGGQAPDYGTSLPPPRPIMVKLSNVELRQYRAGEVQFSFRSQHLLVDQEAQELTAKGEVEVLLADKLWRARQ